MARESDSVNILIDSIIDWAKNLCFTSCGNYLCQQLLDRGEGEDKKRFISEIECVFGVLGLLGAYIRNRLDLIAIASDKFGTHVLCKAVGVKELEVYDEIPVFLSLTMLHRSPSRTLYLLQAFLTP